MGDIRLRLSKLQENDLETRKFTENLPEGWKDIKNIFYYQNLPYISEIICFQIISHHYNDPLAGCFGIKKTKKLVTRKYF